jgi:hypothetical protein
MAKSKVGTAVAALCLSATVLVPGTPVQAAAGWSQTNLSTFAGVPKAGGPIWGYASRLEGDTSESGRIVYRTSTGTIAELTVSPSGWHSAALTALTGSPRPADTVIRGFSTNLDGQGPVGRVVYRAADNHIHELSVTPNGCHHGDLTAATGAPPAAGPPFGYTTRLDGQGEVARIVYEPTSTTSSNSTSPRHEAGGTTP